MVATLGKMTTPSARRPLQVFRGMPLAADCSLTAVAALSAALPRGICAWSVRNSCQPVWLDPEPYARQKVVIMRKALLAGIAMACGVAQAAAQTDADTGRNVTVHIEGIVAEMAAQLDLPEVLLPGEVRVPEHVASRACGPDAATLPLDGGAEPASCAAVVASPELTRFVQDAMVVSGRPVDEEIVDGRPDRVLPDDPSPGLRDLSPQALEALPANGDPGEPRAETAERPPSAVTGDDALDVAPSDLRDRPGQTSDADAARTPPSLVPDAPGAGAARPGPGADPSPTPAPAGE